MHSFSALVTFSLCADTHEEPKNSQMEHYQYKCMMKLLVIDRYRIHGDLKKLRLLLHDDDAHTPCNWGGVRCSDGAITKIYWGPTMRHSRYNLKWFPASVKDVYIHNKELRSTILEVGFIPKSVETFVMKYCCLDGTVDLHRLPPNLRILNLRKNRLSGELRVADLPMSMRYIDVVGNLFLRIIVDSITVPEEFQDFRSCKIPTYWIGKKDPRFHQGDLEEVIE